MIRPWTWGPRWVQCPEVLVLLCHYISLIVLVKSVSSSFSARIDVFKGWRTGFTYETLTSISPERASVNSCKGCNVRFTDSNTSRSCQEGTRCCVFRSAERTSDLARYCSKTLHHLLLRAPPGWAFCNEWVLWEVVLLSVPSPASSWETSHHFLQSAAAKKTIFGHWIYRHNVLSQITSYGLCYFSVAFGCFFLRSHIHTTEKWTVVAMMARF